MENAKKSPQAEKTATDSRTSQEDKKKSVQTRKSTSATRKKAKKKPIRKAPAKKASVPGEGTPLRSGKTTPPLTREELELEFSKLPVRYQLFIEEYQRDFVATRAAIRAGYAPLSASDRANDLMKVPMIAALIKARIQDRLDAIRMSREQVLDAHSQMANADINELVENRRVPCRHCWGDVDEPTGAHAYQYTPSEFVARRERWERDRQAALVGGIPDPGEFSEEMPSTWYDKRKAINPDCPECFGDGVPEIIIKDTRYVSRGARLMYAGVKEGKDGIELKTNSREAALQVMAKHHKIYEDAPQVNLTFATSAELDEIYRQGVADLTKQKDRLIGRGERVAEQLAGRIAAAGQPDPEDESGSNG